MLNRSLKYISRILKAGERIGVAVSGGADSVALLRLLLEARTDVGMVLSVVHFNHKIRGAEADADEAFVRELAQRFQLEWIAESGDTPGHAKTQKVSLETAARRLRYEFFARLTTGQRPRLDKIATAHTMDDQAETVLMRLLRGAGTRGLAGIYPEQRDKHVIRPLLGWRHAELEAYLRELGQTWREDVTNLDLQHMRNRIRHELLPLLVRDYNPGIVEALARTAEVARAEEEHWAIETKRLVPFVLLQGRPVRGGGRASGAGKAEYAIDVEALRRHPEALQRRLLRAAAEKLEIELDADHVQAALEVAQRQSKACELPGGWRLERSFREMRFVKTADRSTAKIYEYSLAIPGEVVVPEMRLLVQARVEALAQGSERDTLVPNPIVITAREVRVRNWRAGDRFQPAHSGSERKVKELLEPMRMQAKERKFWPVVAEADRVIWVRGTRDRQVLLHEGKTFTKVTFECMEQAND
jgi:tRNA(Ile)-lysidine synthase